MTPAAFAGTALPERMDAARVDALFSVAPTVHVTSLAAGALTVAILWEPTRAGSLLGWLAVLAAVTAARVALHRAYRRAPARVAPARWEAAFVLGAFAAGATWATPPIVFFPEGDPLAQMALLVVVVASVVGAAGVYAASTGAFLGYAALPLLAVLGQLALQPGGTYRLLALLTLLFAAAMLRVHRDMRRAVLAHLAARVENEALLARVAASEARLREAIENHPEGIAVFDADDRLLVCNETYAAVYGGGKSPAQLVGTPYRDIAANAWRAEEVPPAYEGRFDDWLAERLARRALGAGAVRHYRTRDGRTLQGRFVRSAGGGIVSVFTDVTELVRAQQAYERVLAEENLVLDTLPVGVAFLSDRTIVRCNRRLEQMLGYEAGELAGASSRRLYPDEQAWRRAGAGYARLRGGALLEAEVELARKDGARLWCRLVTRALDPERPERSAIVAFTDVSQARAAAEALAAREAMYRNLVETSNDLIWSMDTAGRWTYVNPGAVRRIYRCRAEDLLGRDFRELTVEPLRARDWTVFQRVFAGEAVFDHETRHVRRDGTRVDLAFNAVPLRDAAGAIVGATGTAHDVTREKQAQAALHESVEKLRLAVEVAGLVYWEWDRDRDRLHWGSEPLVPGGQDGGRAARWSDYCALVHPDDRARFLEQVASAWQGTQTCAAEYRVVGRDGRVRWIATRGKAIADAAGRPRRMIGVSQDVTERKREEERARYLAYHDTLTGLPNRRLLEDRLRQALYVAERRGEAVAVMMLDLDRFKQVNDSLGHRAGDAVLVEAARRLGGCVRRADTLARHGGDEFAIVLAGGRAAEDARVVAEKILRAFEAPFVVGGGEFAIGTSIGVSLFPGEATDAEGLLRNADVAMYRAKQSGRHRCVFYGGSPEAPPG
ncbi:MAG: PAS domain S-box protein [Burkholderiales bacterium]|nr:PAS domain S-box protein [Burkholderiales bacterium]